VISNEQKNYAKAKEYYLKAIELNPKYKDAYVNLGAVLLVKDQELVEEMNANLSNFDKYDKIKAKQVDLYKEVIPYYEKAYALDSDDIDIVRTLMSLYENVEMDAKFKEMKAKYDSMK
jgi:tetratricopeptide (TPR) repeat protein